MVIASLLTIAALGVIFLAALIRLWQHPPVLNVNVNVPDIVLPDINLSGLSIPDRINLALLLKHEPADIEVKPTEEPIPEDILDYILQESEMHAQDARKRRVRALKTETGSWAAAFRMLQKEDNPFDY